MAFWDTSCRRTLVLILAGLVASTLIYLSIIDTTKPSLTPNSHTVSADYLESQQQQPFEASSNHSVPWKCTCYNYDSGEESTLPADEPPPKEHGEASPVLVPESFADPPSELMDKINNNMHDGRVLIVATANYGMREYIYNWIESMKRTGEDKFVIFCLDDKLYTHLVNAGYESHAVQIPEMWYHQDVASNFEEYYTPQYRIITHAKTLVVQRLLYLDITVLFTDVDVVWLRPRTREYLKTFLDIRPDTHVIFQQEGLDERQVNTGFYMMRPATDMKRLLAETIYLQDTEEGLTQQGALNKALNDIVMDIRTSSVVLLDVIYFPNGYSYFDNDLSKSLGIEPYILHANYRVSLQIAQHMFMHSTECILGWRC